MTEEKNLVETIVEQYISFMRDIYSRLERLEKSMIEQNKYNVTVLELIIKLYEKDIKLEPMFLEQLEKLKKAVKPNV